MRRARISATGMYVPSKLVTNDDLAKMMDTSDEWIRQRSGIETRYHVPEPGVEGTSDLAYEAAKIALQKRGITATELDLVIVATLSPDHQFPGSAALLQARLGLETTPSMDIRCQCSGFLYALNVAKLFVTSGQYERVLVVGAEVHSSNLDFTTRGRDVAVLFGDGAGAVIVEASDQPGHGEIISNHLHSQGEFHNKLWIEKPGSKNGKYFPDAEEFVRNFPYMDGRFVFKHAVVRLKECVEEVLEHNKMAIEELDHFLFHQANLRINEMVAKTLKIPAEKCHNNIQKYGNCSAAAIPMLMHETIESGKVKEGQYMCLGAFGAGFTWASALIRW